MRIVGLLLICLAFLTVGTAQAQCPTGEMLVNGECGTAALDNLQAGWNRIDPGGETVCAHGDPYMYWVYPGETDNLLLYFQGGGGCWNATTCRDDGAAFNGFMSQRISANNNPARRGGVLALDHPENPFGDYTVVYIPVCTGDVHWGDQVTDFGDDVVINFKGFVNAQTAIQWAYANVPEPESIFMTGCSAGSPGSLMHAPYVIDHYPDVPLVQIGDSLSLINQGPVDFQRIWGAHDNFPDWISALAEMQPLEWTMARHYSAVANHYPDYIFGQFNTVRDRVQVFYTFPAGTGDADDWTRLLETHLTAAQAGAPNYRSYTSGGNLHCITPVNAFYTYAINGVRFVDWMADLAAGRAVASLHCEDCAAPEVVRQGQ